MSRVAKQVDELLEAAGRLAYGPERVALTEEAVRLADARGDVKAGFRARQALLSAATFAGRPDLLLVAFSWCLGQSDRDPKKFPQEQLLWSYKWVVGNALGIPDIVLGQIEALLADLARRYERASSSMRVVHMLRNSLAQHRGDRRAAAAAHAAMQRAPRDWLSNCPACEADALVRHFDFLGHWKQAVAAAEPILRGVLRCTEVPARTYARLLLPLWRLGRTAEAADLHWRGYRLIARNPQFVDYVGYHLAFLALTDNLPRAVKLLEKHLPDALATPAMTNRFDFLLAARLLLERLAAQGKELLKLRLPPEVPLSAARGAFQVSALRDWFAGQLRALARRFDARNGTNHFRNRMTAWQRLRNRVTPYPLTTAPAAGGKKG